MDRTFLTITPANIITVMILGLLGYGLLVGSSMLYAKMTTGGGSPAAS